MVFENTFIQKISDGQRLDKTPKYLESYHCYDYGKYAVVEENSRFCLSANLIILIKKTYKPRNFSTLHMTREIFSANQTTIKFR